MRPIFLWLIVDIFDIGDICLSDVIIIAQGQIVSLAVVLQGQIRVDVLL